MMVRIGRYMLLVLSITIVEIGNILSSCEAQVAARLRWFVILSVVCSVRYVDFSLSQHD